MNEEKCRFVSDEEAFYKNNISYNNTFGSEIKIVMSVFNINYFKDKLYNYDNNRAYKISLLRDIKRNIKFIFNSLKNLNK